MHSLLGNARLVGYVHVQVGSRVFELPVQALKFERDSDNTAGHAGGFFEEGGQIGILVDEESADSVQDQIVRASAEAAEHLARRLLN